MGCRLIQQQGPYARYARGPHQCPGDGDAPQFPWAERSAAPVQQGLAVNHAQRFGKGGVAGSQSSIEREFVFNGVHQQYRVLGNPRNGFSAPPRDGAPHGEPGGNNPGSQQIHQCRFSAAAWSAQGGDGSRLEGESDTTEERSAGGGEAGTQTLHHQRLRSIGGRLARTGLNARRAGGVHAGSDPRADFLTVLAGMMRRADLP